MAAISPAKFMQTAIPAPAPRERGTEDFSRIVQDAAKRHDLRAAPSPGAQNALEGKTGATGSRQSSEAKAESPPEDGEADGNVNITDESATTDTKASASDETSSDEGETDSEQGDALLSDDNDSVDVGETGQEEITVSLPAAAQATVVHPQADQQQSAAKEQSAKPAASAGAAGSVDAATVAVSSEADFDGHGNESSTERRPDSQSTLKIDGESSKFNRSPLYINAAQASQSVDPGSGSSSTAQVLPTVQAAQANPAPSPAISLTPLPTPEGDAAANQSDPNAARIARGLQTALQQRSGSVTLRLNPPELGTVRIQMDMKDGVVRASFTAQTDSVRHLLQHQLGSLRHTLEGQGLVVERLQVQMGSSNLGQNASQDSFEQSADGRSRGRFDGHDDRGRRGEQPAARQAAFEGELDRLQS